MINHVVCGGCKLLVAKEAKILTNIFTMVSKVGYLSSATNSPYQQKMFPGNICEIYLVYLKDLGYEKVQPWHFTSYIKLVESKLTNVLSGWWMWEARNIVLFFPILPGVESSFVLDTQSVHEYEVWTTTTRESGVSYCHLSCTLKLLYHS